MKTVETLQNEMHEFIEAFKSQAPNFAGTYQDIANIFFLMKISELENKKQNNKSI